MDTINSIIPGLPDDLALECLARIPIASPRQLHRLCLVSKPWKAAIESPQLIAQRHVIAPDGLLFFPAVWGARPGSLTGVHVDLRSGATSDIFFNSSATSDAGAASDSAREQCLAMSELRAMFSPGHVSVNVAGMLLVLGGDRAPRQTQRLNVSRWDWSSGAPMHTPRSQFAWAAIRGRVYAAGGRCPFTSTWHAAAEAYDPWHDTWIHVAAMPFALRILHFWTISDRFYIFGTKFETKNKSLLCYLPPPTNKWVIEDLSKHPYLADIDIDIPGDTKLALGDTTSIFTSDNNLFKAHYQLTHPGQMSHNLASLMFKCTLTKLNLHTLEWEHVKSSSCTYENLSLPHNFQHPSCPHLLHLPNGFSFKHKVPILWQHIMKKPFVNLDVVDDSHGTMISCKVLPCQGEVIHISIQGPPLWYLTFIKI